MKVRAITNTAATFVSGRSLGLKRLWKIQIGSVS